MPSDRSILDFIGTFPEKDEEEKEEKSSKDGFASFVKSIPKSKAKESRDKQRLDSARRQLEESWSSDAQSIMVGMGAPIVSMIERLTGQGERASEMSRVNSAIQQAARERDPEGVGGLAQRGLRGALQNIPPMLLAGAAGGPAGVIGYYAAQEANEAITTGQDAGLKGKALARYAIEKGAIEGGITAAFQKVGLGGAESVAGGKLAASSGVKSALKRLGFGTIAELGEENTIELVGAVADKFRGVDPDALNPENIASSAAEVTATTLWTMGLIEGPNVVRSAKNSKVRAEITKHAEEGKVPSRKTWKSWGLPVDLGKNEGLRKTATNSMAENFQNEGKQVLESIQAEAEQPEAAEVAQPTREASPALPALTPEIEPSDAAGQPEAADRPWEVTPEILDDMIASESSTQAQIEDELFGKKRAKQYQIAQRTSNRVLATDEQQAEAGHLVKQLESELTEAQRNRLFGISEVGLDVETLKRFRKAARNIDAGSPESLGFSIADVLVDLSRNLEKGHTNPEQMDVAGQLAVTRINQAMRLSQANNYNWEKVWEASLSRVANHLGPDAMELLAPFRKRAPASGAAEASVVSPQALLEDAVSPRLEAQEAAEEARPDSPGFLKEETGAKPINERLGEVGRADVIGDPARQYTKGGKVDLSANDFEVDRRLGTKLIKESIPERLKRFGARTWAFVTRPQPLLPKEDRFIFAQETIRLLKAVPQMAVDESIRTVASIVDPLGPKQMELFERSILVSNQLRSLKKDQPLRYGFKNQKQVEAYKQKVDALVESTPEVKKAIETRQLIVNETVGKLVEKKLLPESTLQNTEDYFHQQVSMIQEAKGKAGRAGSLTKRKKSFQKKRVKGRELGEEYDPNTSYIESETEWLADAFSELRKTELLENLVQRYDRSGEFRDAAKELGMNLEDYVRELDGHDLWQPEPGNVFYQAYSIPERIGEKLQQEVIKEHNLTKDEIRQVLALGGKHRSAALPTDLVNQLESMETKDNAHWVGELHRKAMSSWKSWTLLNPKRLPGYMFRNFTGDMDAVLAGNPRIIKRMPAATKELMKYHFGRIHISDNMRLARDLGVVGAGFFGAEVEETSEMQIFRRLKPAEQRKLMRNPVKVYMEIVRPSVELRENVLRYAAFLESRDQIKSGNLSHYGAAKRINVQTLEKEMGADVAAAHMSRELLGDYGNLTEAGEFLRLKLTPFWAFQEINLKRYPRLVINAIQSGQGRGRTAVVISAAAMLRIGAGYGALWTWNNLLIPAMFGGEDLEDTLGSYDRANPHILLGKNPDGTTRTFRNVGALGDYLEWGGINEGLALWDEFKAGQVDVGDVAYEMAKAPLEKIIGSLRPDLKAGYELITGQSLFPSPFHPRSIDKGEAIPNVFGLTDEYRWAKGLVVGEGNRARTNYWQRWLVGVVDPRQTALGEMYDSRRRFLESKGVREGGVYPISEYKQAREAAASENYDAFVEWKKAFVAKHGQRSWKKFKAFRGRLDPIASRLSDADEIEFEYEYLDAGQRRKLQMVRDYAWELDVRLLLWWEASAQKAPRPEEPEWMRRSE